MNLPGCSRVPSRWSGWEGGITAACFLVVLSGLIGCGNPSREQQLRRAKQLLETEPLSSPIRIEPPASGERFERFARLKLRADQKRPFVLRRLAEHHRRDRAWRKASRRVKQLIELQPLDPRWYVLKGEVHGQWGANDEKHLPVAEEAFLNALELAGGEDEPVAVRARYGLGLLYAFQADEPEQGRRQLLEVVRSRETVKNRILIERARFALGKLAYRQDRLMEARDQFLEIAGMKAIPAFSRSRALRNLSRVFERLGDPSMAQRSQELADRVGRRELDLDGIRRSLEYFR